jgi:hypothetical protein
MHLPTTADRAREVTRRAIVLWTRGEESSTGLVELFDVTDGTNDVRTTMN